MNIFKIISANILVLVGILFILELIFSLTNPLNSLPVNGVIGGVHFTWGHQVSVNKLGFREKEVVIPKPKNIYRIVVLGDSLTWGAGLSIDQRYTYLTEMILKNESRELDIEVLNFGISGGPMIAHHKILKQLKNIIEPDLIVIGFCLNDPQPRSQDYSREREEYLSKYSKFLSFFESLQIVLPNLSNKFISSFWVLLEKMEKVPTWYDALDRTYNKNSSEWKQFSQALQGIYNISNDLELHKPIFLVLNQGSSTINPTFYSNPDPILEKFISWYTQAENEAREIGFLTANHMMEFSNTLDGEVLGVNILDGHPSYKENIIYAEKLSKIIDEIYLDNIY